MPETIQAYLEAVQAQIRWKRARPVLIQELERHLEDQRDDLLKEGKPAEEAERLAVEDMGDPVTVGAELDAVHRPRPQWGLLGLTFALALTGTVLRAFFFRADPHTLSIYVLARTFASLGLGAAAMLGLYLLDVSRLARHGRALYIAVLLLGGGMFLLSVSQPPFRSPGSYRLLFYLSQTFPVVYALWIYTRRGGRWRGFSLSIAGGVPLAIVCAIYPSMTNLILLSLSVLVLMLLAAGQDWFGVGRRKGLCVVLGAASGLLAYLFSRGYHTAFLERIQIALHPELDPLGRGFCSWMFYMFWEDVRPFQDHLGTAGIGGIAVVRGPNGREWGAMDFGCNFLPAELARSWGWVPLLLLLAALTALLLWLLVKGLRQTYLLGRFVVLAVVISLAVQTLFSVMLNFGLVLSFASLPLMVGDLQTVVDMALIGLALSVFRGGSIAREEPARPLRQRKRLRIKVEYQ